MENSYDAWANFEVFAELLSKLSRETGEPISQLVVDILSHGLGISLHTLFQVSTSGALSMEFTKGRGRATQS
jgi:hypothetical protein